MVSDIRNYWLSVHKMTMLSQEATILDDCYRVIVLSEDNPIVNLDACVLVMVRRLRLTVFFGDHGDTLSFTSILLGAVAEALSPGILQVLWWKSWRMLVQTFAHLVVFLGLSALCGTYLFLDRQGGCFQAEVFFIFHQLICILPDTLVNFHIAFRH